jgi:hypothetical protein
MTKSPSEVTQRPVHPQASTVILDAGLLKFGFVRLRATSATQPQIFTILVDVSVRSSMTLWDTSVTLVFFFP